MTYKSRQILKHESFAQLSVDAINVVVTNAVFAASDADVFQAVVNWMKANPSKSADFPNVLKNVPLDSITLGKLVDVPSDLIDANVLVTLARDQQAGSGFILQDKNFALPKYGVKVVDGGETSFFDDDGGSVLKHNIGSSEEGIVVDLGHRFWLNSLEMHLGDTDGRKCSYWIDVSEDNINWTRIVDHSKYQKLYFNERAVRYIRICGTAPVDDTFEISRLEAFYTSEPFEVDAGTMMVVPSNNRH